MRRFSASRVSSIASPHQRFLRQSCIGAFALVQHRHFNPNGFEGPRYATWRKLSDVNALVGRPRAKEKEGEWACRYKDTQRLIDIAPDIMKRAGWEKEEIEREMAEMLSNHQRCNSIAIATVGEFQRVPRNRRWKLTDLRDAQFNTIDLLQLFEKELIPPSGRVDHYEHLRTKQFEENFFYESASHEHNAHITRDRMRRWNKKSPTANTDEDGKKKDAPMTRKEFLKYSNKFDRENKGSWKDIGASYKAFVDEHGGKVDHRYDPIKPGYRQESSRRVENSMVNPYGDR